MHLNQSHIKLPSKMPTIWQEIISFDQQMLDLYNFRKEEQRLKLGRVPLASQYFENEIYPQLIPALKTTLELATRKCALKYQKCIFNGIDCLAEVLYNRNPKYPERAKNWTPAYFLFFNPETDKRPFYPISWILTAQEAALIIQKWVRGYNVRKTYSVQEMKGFWKAVQEAKWVLTSKKVPVARCKKRDPRDIRCF